jgi:hypothetical protein
MTNRLITKFLENYPYKDEFEKDLDSWQLLIGAYINKMNSPNKLKLKGYIYPLSDSFNLLKIDRVIVETISHVGIISYTYGAIGREDEKEYKKIHFCKYIASFIYYFMLYLPYEPKDIKPENDIRRLNAIIARSIGLLMKQNKANSFSELKTDMDEKLVNEFLYSLVNNYFKTPEELYLFCRAFNDIKTKA